MANTAAADDPRLAENEAVKVFSEQVPYAHFYLQQLTNFNEIDADVITPAIEKILLDDSDVKETLDEAAKQMDMLLGN